MKNVFKMPKAVSAAGKSSVITNSFINGIIPCIKPTEEQIDEALTMLGMNRETICCAYCGDTYTEWDHLNPLVVNKTPTGYISEIHNLVPACGKCNQSKGNKKWHEWIVSSAPLSPKTKGISDLEIRIERLEKYEEEFEPIKLNFEDIVDKDLWDKHWDNYETIINAIKEAQQTFKEIKDSVNLYVSSELID